MQIPAGEKQSGEIVATISIAAVLRLVSESEVRIILRRLRFANFGFEGTLATYWI